MVGQRQLVASVLFCGVVLVFFLFTSIHSPTVSRRRRPMVAAMKLSLINERTKSGRNPGHPLVARVQAGQKNVQTSRHLRGKTRPEARTGVDSSPRRLNALSTARRRTTVPPATVQHRHLRTTSPRARTALPTAKATTTPAPITTATRRRLAVPSKRRQQAVPTITPKIGTKRHIGPTATITRQRPGVGSKWPPKAKQTLKCPSQRLPELCCAGWSTFLSSSRQDALASVAARKAQKLSSPPVEKKANCRRILLIVIFNWVYYQNVPKVKQLYSKVFTDIVFYGPEADPGHGVYGEEIQDGFLFHRALARAIAAFPDYDGYLWAGDDVFLNYPMLLSQMNPDAIWANTRKGTATMDLSRNDSPNWVHWREPIGLPAVQAALPCMKREWLQRRAQRLGCPACVVHGLVDVGYVPAAMSVEFTQCLYVLWDVMMEIAIQMCELLVAKDPSKIATLVGEVNVWRPQFRTIAWLDAHEFNNTPAVHPMKLSSPSMVGMMDTWLHQSRAFHRSSPKLPICGSSRS
ncbi:uncharacterized protein LOC135830094 [Sycon ciliatum]|uniref:uncharacterized protein LOC135830094 n=1 Tax=Sycon ciliatum TaxID=27933 RepID=UPI0031F6C36A